MYDDTKKKVMNMSTLCKPRIKRTTFKKWKLPERNRICAKGFIDCEFYKELEKKKKHIKIYKKIKKKILQKYRKY